MTCGTIESSDTWWTSGAASWIGCAGSRTRSPPVVCVRSNARDCLALKDGQLAGRELIGDDVTTDGGSPRRSELTDSRSLTGRTCVAARGSLPGGRDGICLVGVDLEAVPQFAGWVEE